MTFCTFVDMFYVTMMMFTSTSLKVKTNCLCESIHATFVLFLLFIGCGDIHCSVHEWWVL